MAVVTGAAGGIGKAIAKSLLDDDHHLVLVDRDPTVEATARELGERSAAIEHCTVDLSDRDSLAAFTADMIDRYGGCDVLVNNAGVHLYTSEGVVSRSEEITDNQWDLTLSINLTAPFLLTRAFLPGMAERGWGRVINVSSRAGRTYSSGGNCAYGASKAGLIGLTRVIAAEYAHVGVTANTVAPGRVESQMALGQGEASRQEGLRGTPRGTFATPSEIAAVVSFLASDAAANLVGSVIDTNGGAFIP